jgi:hypothetical protein
MQREHVSGPLVVTPQDVADAACFLHAVGIPLVASVLGFDSRREGRLHDLVRRDADYLEQSLPLPATRRKLPTVDSFARACGVSRTTFYKAADEIARDAEQAAVTLALLCAAAGGFGGPTVTRVIDMRSPVRRGARGPGIVDGQQFLYGLALDGGDIELPLVLRIPSGRHISSDRLAVEIGSLLELVHSVIQALERFAADEQNEQRHDRQLACLGLSCQALRELTAAQSLRPSALIVPAIRVNPSSNGLTLQPQVATPKKMFSEASKCGFDRVLVEIRDTPFDQPSRWKLLPTENTATLLAFAFARMGLDLHPKASTVTFWLRSDWAAIHRQQHADPEATTRLPDVTFAFQGFDVRGDDLMEPAYVLGYAEFSATNPNAEECAQRFGREFTPSLVKAPTASIRAIVRELPALINVPLVTGVRWREWERRRQPKGT